MAYQHNNTAQSASDKAIEKFAEMMITRLEEAKDRDYISQQEIETLAKWRLAPDKWN